jgi:hypothetical protein
MVVKISFRSGSAKKSGIQSWMVREINYQFLVSEVLMASHIMHPGEMWSHFVKEVYELVFRNEYKRLFTVERVNVVP